MSGAYSFIDLLKRAPRAKLVALFVLMTLLGLTEGVGLVLLVPLLSLLYGEEAEGDSLVEALVVALDFIGLEARLESVLAVFVGLIVARSLIQVSHERTAARLQHEVVDGLRLECFKALLRAGWGWTSQRRQSDNINHIVTNVNRVGLGLTVGLSFSVLAVTSAVYLAVAFGLNATMTGLALASGGGIFLLLARQRKTALSLGESLGGANRAMQAIVQECLSGIKIAKILGIETEFASRLSDVIARLRQQQITFVTTSATSRALFNTLGAVLLTAYLYVAVTFLEMSLPTLFVFVFIFARLIPNFMALQRNVQQWLYAKPAWAEIASLLQEAGVEAEPVLSADVVVRLSDKLTLDKACFTYQSRMTPALSNLQVTIGARTTVAVVGPSGAGKSTFADIVMGLIEPDNGQLLVDGLPVTGARRMAWRSSVAYVPQDVFLFNDTIAANLRWSSADASDSELCEALERSAADFVFALPAGLDTVVGDGGVLLSGGEKQRLALARALLHRPDLLILDEATSALDVASEKRILAAVENLHGRLTVIVIGHRLAFLEKADKIIVLEGGAIKKAGTWDEVRYVV